MPRKSLSRTNQHVQFEDVPRLSSSVSDMSSRPNDSSNLEDKQKSLSSRDISLMVSSKNSSASADDVFYSPETSANEIHDDTAAEKMDEKEQTKESVTEEVVDKQAEKEKQEKDVASQQVVASPRARRSYKSMYK